MRTATRKTPISPAVLLEKIIKVISNYPLEHIEILSNLSKKDTVEKFVKELNPEIIISESFS